jgi:hypothetical protein
MDALRTHQHRLSPGSLVEFRRHTSWIQARRGQLDSLPLLDSLYRDGAVTLSACTDYMQALRFRGLRPQPDIAAWIERGRRVLAENGHTRAIMDQVIGETFAVATAEGIVLPWASAAEYRATFYDRLVPSTFHHRSSMLQDLERGRRTEIDAINGEVWKRAAAHGMVTPINELLTRLVHAREALRAPNAPPAPRHLADP